MIFLVKLYGIIISILLYNPILRTDSIWCKFDMTPTPCEQFRNRGSNKGRRCTPRKIQSNSTRIFQLQYKYKNRPKKTKNLRRRKVFEQRCAQDHKTTAFRVELWSCGTVHSAARKLSDEKTLDKNKFVQTMILASY